MRMLGVILIVVGLAVLIGNLTDLVRIPMALGIFLAAGGVLALLLARGPGFTTAGIEEWPHSD